MRRGLIQAVLWERLDEPGFEHCRLWERSDSYVLEGSVLAAVANAPAEVHYEVECDPQWQTRFVRVSLTSGNVSRRMEIRRDENGGWSRDGAGIPDLVGVLDIDLGITPATNTLPIRRLEMEVGASASIDAAWLRFPELELERLTQRYTRLADRLYRYESAGGAFVAELTVDGHGLVVQYGELWARRAALFLGA